MTPNISKELKKATEDLHAKMLAMQTEEEKMMTLRDAFVKATDPAKKEKLKPALIKQHKILKAAEDAADAADAAFHKILEKEPEELYDLLDHVVQEHVVRLAVRRIVKEATEEPVSVDEEVFKFFESNKKKLEGLAEDSDWDEFYQLAFDKFEDYDQDKVAQAMNVAAMRAGWFENEIEDFRQNEKELDMMANGTKEQQKGVDMGDYTKKNKLPKASPTDLVVGDLKKLKESKKKVNEAEELEEAEYRGRKVKLGKPFYTPGGPRKRAVYVKNDKGNVVKVGFGEPGMKIKKNNPERRKSFRARHNCDNPGPRWKARYWSCRFW